MKDFDDQEVCKRMLEIRKFQGYVSGIKESFDEESESEYSDILRKIF